MSPTKPNPSLSKRSSKTRKAISLLDEIEPFKGLSQTELASLFDEMEIRTYPAGSIIFTPGDPSCERLYILKQGRVDLYRLTASGKRLVTRQILPGATFGVRGLLGRAMQGNFAQATEDSTIYIISREHILALLERQPELALRVLEAVCNRLRLLEERLVEAVYNPVSVRLAYFLLASVDSASGVISNVTHEEIGNTIGAVRQTVTETLSLMRRQGFILTEPKQIRIINQRGLEEMIRGSES